MANKPFKTLNFGGEDTYYPQVNWSNITDKPEVTDGKSAYDLALEGGFEGSEEEWIASLKGDKGDTGATGARGADGQNGSDGYTPVRGVDYWTSADQQAIEDDSHNFITTELAKRGQLKPEFANSTEECTDTSKLYVLPDGYIYACMETATAGGEPLFSNLASPSSSDWKSNSRINASGAIASSSESGAFVSNAFDCKQGDILRVKGVTESTGTTATSAYFCLMPLKSDGTNAIGSAAIYIMTPNASGVGSSSNKVESIVNVTADGVYEYEILKVIDTSSGDTINHTNSASVTGARVSGIATDGAENVIITINEEIKYSEASTGYAWVSTGHAFVPADYEDRILDLEEKTEENSEAIAGLKNADNLTPDILFNGIKFTPEWESGTFAQTIGSTDTNVANVARLRMTTKVSLPYSVLIESDGTYAFLAALFGADGTVSETQYYTTTPYYIPANTPFRLILANASDNTVDISTATAGEINSRIVISEIRLNGLLNPPVKWCAMGDSITEGYVSYLNGTTPTSKVDRPNAWAVKLAELTGWTLTNKAIGGTGYIDLENSDTAGTTAAWNIAQSTDFTPYNLVTLAYGVNDWKGNIPLGTINDDTATPTTIYGGMKATIEAIMNSNPFCKIVVLTPLNCAGYDFNYGTEATNWGLSKSFSNNGTLEDVYQAIVNVCEYYGIEYVDLTHKSVVNRLNILDCLTDGVHPNAETHTLLAVELAKKVPF